MSLTSSQFRAIEIMREQMERLEMALRHNRESENQRPSTEVVLKFYDERTRMGAFEMNYLNTIGKTLAPDAKYEDGIVTTVL